MKTARLFLFVLLLLGVFPGMGSAATSVGVHVGPSGRATVDIGFFYDDLAPYGNWVQRPSYGWVWRPHAVASSWHPYQRGHWVQTEDGWTWISSEPYGWATYHYGRWYRDASFGWEWVPGNEWAPAWVSWQEGGDYVGWAPLPPSVEFRGGGFGGVDFSAAISPESYLFVPQRQFLAPRLDSYYVARGRQGDIFRQTRNITNYRVVDNRIINQGLPVDRVQQVIGRSVPRYQIADQGENLRHQGGRIQANRVAFFRPQIQQAANILPPPERQAARRAVVSPDAVQATHAGRKAQQQEGRQLGVEARQGNRPINRPGRPQDVQTAQRQRHERPAPEAHARQPHRPREPRPPQAREQQRPPHQAAQNHPQQGQGKPAGKPHGGNPNNDKPRGKPPGAPGDGPGL